MVISTVKLSPSSDSCQCRVTFTLNMPSGPSTVASSTMSIPFPSADHFGVRLALTTSTPFVAVGL
ncbi:MAG TPA: hypothetical protein VF717_19300 [Pyrinomonadaceae bacterium]